MRKRLGQEEIPTVDELRAQAARLRREAFALLDGTGLAALLHSALGAVEVVGSMAFDLMTWPDIDLYVCLEPDEGVRLVALLPAIYRQLEERGFAVVKAGVNDEYRRPNSPWPGGLYLGLLILPPSGPPAWKIDLWAWRTIEFAEKLEVHRRLAAALASADRDAVLRIKHAVCQRPEYRRFLTLTSMDIYDFVLTGAGTTVEEFDALSIVNRPNLR
jgi:hypothetical protein